VSLNFYRDILGFVEVFSWTPGAPYIGELVGYPNVQLKSTILSMPNTEFFLELIEYIGIDGLSIDSANGNPGTAHIAFFVDSVDRLFEELVGKGVKSVSAPVTPTIGPNKGGRAVYMIDPDGIRIEFIETRQSFVDYAKATC
jgi:catechol 2,3-dioxygenase-like lactoylglutathione lyase family enzyme